MILNQELSYKQICEQFNELPAKSGRAREQQMNRWSKIAEVEKFGRGRYIIKRQLSEEEIQEKEYTKNYSKFLQNMLIKLFAEQDGEIQTYTYRQLREYLNMVNQHYFPVKYGNESIELSAPCKINLNNVFREEDKTDRELLAEQERSWFFAADNHDKDALHYALKALKGRGLLADYRFTYMFYKSKICDNGNVVYSRPVVAKDEQIAELHQRIMDFLKNNLTSKQIEEIEKTAGLDESKIFGLYKKTVLSKGENTRMRYGDIPSDYAKEIGYSGYAKAITIIKPTRLDTLIATFAPKFNSVQVKEYFKSKRFKNLPFSLHEQLTNQLIKTQALKISAEELIEGEN